MARGFMGLRPSEARRANLADYWFDPDTGRCRDILTVRKSKSKRFRLLPTLTSRAGYESTTRTTRTFATPTHPTCRYSPTPTRSMTASAGLPHPSVG